jgi:hypothetical protein
MNHPHHTPASDCRDFPESDGQSDLRCRDRASFPRLELLLDPISGSQVEIGRLARRIQVSVDMSWFRSQGLWEMGFLERSPVWLVPHRTRNDSDGRRINTRSGSAVACKPFSLELFCPSSGNYVIIIIR